MALFSFALPTLQNNGSITYGAFDTFIPQPHEVVHTPPQILGISGVGVPELGVWGQLQWTYHSLPTDQWYYLMNAYRKTRDGTNPLWGQVLVQWPDPSQNNALVSATARLETPTSQVRTPRIVNGLVLLFTHLGYDNTHAAVPGSYYQPPNFF